MDIMNNNNNNNDIKNEIQKGIIHLSSSEKFISKYPIPAVGTVTFFEKIGGSNEAVERYLRARVAETVTANPWLTTKFNNYKEFGVIGQYSVSGPFPDCFNVGAPRTLSIAEGGYEDFTNAFHDCMIPTTYARVGSSAPGFKVTLVPGDGEDSNLLAVVVSLCHIIGDGHTIYQIQNMLSRTAEVRALNPERSPEVDDAMRASMAPGEFDIMANPGASTIIGALCKHFFGGSLKICAFEVDDNAVNAKKAEYAAAAVTSPKFISTNDILTSWAMKVTKCDVGEMIVNMRSRLTALPKMGDNVAGNVAISLSYRPEDYRTPELIRRSLTDKPGLFHRAGNGSSPDFWTNLKYNNTKVTNWAGFAEDLDLPGCERMLHCPLMEWGMVRGINVAVLFRPRKGVTAVMMLSPTVRAEEMEKEELLGKRIF